MQTLVTFPGAGRERTERYESYLEPLEIRPRAVLCGAAHERYAIGNVVIRPACRPEPAKALMTDLLDIFEGSPSAISIGLGRLFAHVKRLCKTVLNILQVN